jgi:hypothetical protein
VHVPEQSHLFEPSGSASRRGRASAGGQRRLPAPTTGCGSLALSPDTMTASSQVCGPAGTRAPVTCAGGR